MKPNLQVAIDGPAGVGKSTLGRMLAQRYHLLYLDTGAMYRAVALAALEAGIAAVEGPEMDRWLAGVEIRFEPNPTQPRIFLGERDVSESIRSAEVTAHSSRMAALSSVRRRLVALQQATAQQGRVILEGRDIGTVVLPRAEVKLFLTASPEIRAQRRYQELIDKGQKVELAEVLEAQRQRDERDQGRADSPTIPAADALVLDTSWLGLEEIISRIGALIEKVDERSGSA